MKALYLLRHAKSSWDEPGLDDFDRPLADRGLRACRTMAGYIEQENIAPDFVLCSPAKRTRATLDGIREGFADEPRIEVPDELYGGGAGAILALVNDLPTEAESTMVIGHNPAIQSATLQLAAEGDYLDAVRTKFPTAALATIGFDVASWTDVVPDSGRLTGFVRPRELG